MPTPIHKREVLKLWRKEAGLSQTALAVQAGISRNPIARGELHGYVSLETLNAIACVLNRPIRELLTEEAKKKFAPLVATA